MFKIYTLESFEWGKINISKKILTFLQQVINI